MLKKICALFFFVCLFSFSLAFAESKVIEVPLQTHEPPIIVYQDIIYSEITVWPRKKLRMDIFMPYTKEKKPAVIFLPGGFWITAPKTVGNEIMTGLAKEGFVGVSIEYRLVGEADYKEIIGDVKSAVRYLRANADKFGIDKNKIGIMGESAGGYLANMAGVTGDTKKFDVGDNLDEDSGVQAVVDFFGPTDLTKIAADYPKEKEALYMSASSPVSLLVNGVAAYKGRKGGSILDTPKTAKDANPLAYINKNTPPFLIMHGDLDQTVSPSQSKILYDALEKNGVYAEYYILKGYGHDFSFACQKTVFDIILKFLNKTLRN